MNFPVKDLYDNTFQKTLKSKVIPLTVVEEISVDGSMQTANCSKICVFPLYPQRKIETIMMIKWFRYILDKSNLSLSAVAVNI